MAANAISKARFEALSFARRPTVNFFVEEREWYADQDENVLGVLTWDLHDLDWGYVVLGRDERALFRSIDVEVSFPDIDTARHKLHLKLSYYSISGENVFPQGDEARQRKFEIFKQLVSQDDLHPHFRMLSEKKGYSPAKAIIAEIAYSFQDPDGNYIQQFQTTGYAARLWELFLYAFLRENDFLIDRSFPAPDYLCKKFDETIFLEALTVNPTQGQEATEVSPDTVSDPDILADYVAIKFGSALTSKLNKNSPYWELAHVKDKALIFAIADFHQQGSMLWTHPYLTEYLYGIRARKIKVGEQEQVNYEVIREHIFGDKRIPSGFFSLPKSENVSAVLFTNSGTISKFNRMGKLAGFGDKDIKMVRVGKRYDFSEGSLEPADFSMEVEEGKCTETWSEGVSIFHNPKAKYPVDEMLFSRAGHHHFRDGVIMSHLPDFCPIYSVTQIVTIKDKDTSSG
jgi:hypothetical protein